MRSFAEIDSHIADVRRRKLGITSAAEDGRRTMAARSAAHAPAPPVPADPNRAQRRKAARNKAEGDMFALFGRPMANRTHRARHDRGRRPTPAQAALVRAVNVATLRRTALIEPLDPRRHVDQAVRRARHLGLDAELIAAGYRPSRKAAA